jgi:hypothetical protein
MPDYLRLVTESPIANLLGRGQGTHRLEASGVTVRGDYVYVAFDNTGHVARLHSDLRPNPASAWLGSIEPKEGYEAIVWDDIGEQFYTVIEAIKVGKKRHQALIRVFDRDLTLLQELPVDHNFVRENKGVEGLAVVRRADGLRLLALCEAPTGKGKGRRGQILVLAQTDVWTVEHRMALPSTAAFKDFSDLAIAPTGQLGVVSQEDSCVWIGSLDTQCWTLDDGAVWRCPRDGRGKVVYGNIEGVAWLPDHGGSRRLVMVSDRAKDDQPARCRDKEESIHIFEVP